MAVAPATVGRRQAVADLNTFRPTDRSVSSAVANHLTVHDDQPAKARAPSGEPQRICGVLVRPAVASCHRGEVAGRQLGGEGLTDRPKDHIASYDWRPHVMLLLWRDAHLHPLLSPTVCTRKKEGETCNQGDDPNGGR